MDPWKSWAIVGLVGAGAGYYYTQSGKSKRGRGAAPTAHGEQTQRRRSDLSNDSKDTHKKKGKGKSKASDAFDQAASDIAEASSAPPKSGMTEKTKKRKGGKPQPSKLAQSSAVEVSQESAAGLDDAEEENEMSNKEFAMQLSGLKTGTSLKKTEANKENKKTRNQGKARELPSEPVNGTALKPDSGMNGLNMSTASSTTGADADDDLSLPVSPDLGASATQATTPSGFDVSDMLEAPAKGPSILRLTEPTNPQPVRQPKAQKIAPEPETKKQRQRRQKNEEQKAIREQAEKDRRILLEKQLRTAREAEGRPAKNGLGTSKGPAVSAWDKSSGPQNGASTGAESLSTSDSGPLLDTLDEDKSFLGPSTPHVNGEANEPTRHEEALNRILPSEEEQMRLINQMENDDSWSTVPKGGKGKRKTHAAAPMQSDKTLASSTNALTNDENAPGPRSYKAESQPDDLDFSEQNRSPKEVSSSKNEKMDLPTKTTSITDNSDRHRNDSEEKQVFEQATSTGEGDHSKTAKPVKATFKTIDHDVWTRENIHEHPDYDPDWPYALTGHPLDSDWAADWDSDDMKKPHGKLGKLEAAQ